jgi:hypothetical protein
VHHTSLEKGKKTKKKPFSTRLKPDRERMHQIFKDSMSRQILNGWKEISSYIERGVRTAQRWEALLGMPVYRPALKDRSAVVAFSDELDRWISRTAPDARTPNEAGNEGDTVLRLHNNMRTLTWHTLELASQTRVLQAQLRRSLDIHRNRIAPRMHDRPATDPSRSKAAMLPFRRKNASPPPIPLQSVD